ncbi:uncharacterized protein C8orf34 homolog isoform X3 [Asterias rubens]|uniref:uncharacterized protein C8orf34 homolog isoform X3 n=1 Tax=Asterias rubens TaxID=7604 RepID=UPI0014558327|nr:uncharacterized protein C8orf34 homolog isoform X3 [Asterias rubens]
MASQQRVQTYLEKHRISALFEDLMARVMKHLPNEPIPYIIKILQRFEEKSKPSEPKPSSTMPAVKRTPGGWAAASDPALPGMGEDRGYNRPWTANMKKSKGSMEQDDQAVRKSKKEWDSSKKRTTPTSDTDVEHLFKKGAEKKSAKQWAVSDDENSSPPPRRTGPSAAEEQENQLLKEEMSAAKLQRKYCKDEKTNKAAPSSQELTERRQKPGAKAKKHKQQLAEMAAAQLKVETLGYLDSGEEPTDPDQAGYEEAMDLLEDADELAFEGVTNTKRTGHKVSKVSSRFLGVLMSMRRRPPPPDPEVKVAMCSKCARLIGGGGGDSSTVGGGDGYGKYATLDSMSDVTSGEYGGTFNSPPTASDDDFESASQVVGPRHPVWVEPENGSSGPSNTGLKSTMVHDSSRELFSSTSRGAGNQSSSTYRAQTSLVGQAWDTKTYRSQTEVSTHRVVHTDSLKDLGRSWQQPSSDEDSGF